MNTSPNNKRRRSARKVSTDSEVDFTITTGEQPPAPNDYASKAYDPQVILSAIHDDYGWRVSGVLRHLQRVTSILIRELNQLADANKEAARKVADTCSLWPVLDGRPPAMGQKNRVFFEEIGLAKAVDAHIDLETTPLRKTVPRRWAVRLLNLLVDIRQCISSSEIDASLEGQFRNGPSDQQYHAFWSESAQRERLYPILLEQLKAHVFIPKIKLTWDLIYRIGSLPKFSTETEVVEEWSRVACDLLWFSAKDHPESIVELRAIGEHRRYHPLKKADFQAVDLREVPLETQQRSIDREVDSRLFEEMEKLAQYLKKLKPKKS